VGRGACRCTDSCRVPGLGRTRSCRKRSELCSSHPARRCRLKRVAPADCRTPAPAHIAGHETERIEGHRSLWRTSPEDHARWEAAPAPLDPVTDALQSLGRTMTSDPRDWSADRRMLGSTGCSWAGRPDDPNWRRSRRACRTPRVGRDHCRHAATPASCRLAQQEPIVTDRSMPYGPGAPGLFTASARVVA
jgi:hypothetical protein